MTPGPSPQPAEDDADRVALAADPSPQPFGPLVGPLFWLLIASSLICILAAVVIASAGPQIFHSSKIFAGAKLSPVSASPAATPPGLGKRPVTR